ncbi:MAG TPA: DUF2723 domain-containing protein [Phycisphaerae bacterium]|nr:DUF2723 domain-containing protein [Phycisphaerales bacterium]HRX83402.1 DUF2723 domain-containing protein [Phycisphaerae bacterium]
MAAGDHATHQTTRETTRAARRKAYRAPAGVALAALGVYLATLAPTVTAEDSGELVAAAWHFGIPHPPGYPLWTMLCGAFVHALAGGDIAWRANLFSALCTAAAAGVLCAALRTLRVGTGAAAAAALCWALSRWCWSQAVITEVYGLNALLTALLLLAAVRWRASRNARWLLAASLVFGLGMSNHHIIALAALALIAWILAQQPALLKRWRLVLVALGLFAAGLLPYAYLPLRARTHPAMNWGDPSTFQRLIDHVTRHQYGAVGPIKAEEGRSLARIVSQFEYIGRSVVDDLTVPLALAALVGVGVMLRRERSAAGLFALWLVGTAGLFVLLANFDLDRVSRFALRVFLIPVVMGTAIPLAFALDQLARVARRPRAQAACSLGLLLAPAWLAYAHWRQCDYSDYHYARDHATNLLACMLPNALYFPSGDHNTFPVAYLVLVEGVRDDVVIADLYGYTRPDLYADQPPDSTDTPEAWIIKRAHRPVYYATKKSPPVAHAHFVQAGMLYHLLPDGMAFDGAGLLAKCHYRNHAPQHPTVLDLGAAHINADFQFFSGLAALRADDVPTAEEHFRSAARFGAEIKEVFNNIGSALAEYGHPAQAEPYFEQAAAIDRHYVLPRWNLYRVAADRGDWPRARERLEDIIACDPDDYRAHGQLGFMLYERFHDVSAARRAWQRSLDLNPHQPQIVERLNASKTPRPG